MLDSTGEQPKMGVTAPSKCVYPGKASPTRPRDKSRLHPTLQRPSPLKRLERIHDRKCEGIAVERCVRVQEQQIPRRDVLASRSHPRNYVQFGFRTVHHCGADPMARSEEHTSELQSLRHLV